MNLPYLQIIGNGDAFGSGGRYHTSFLIHTGISTFLVDLGATSIMGLSQHEINSDSIDYIVISHFHGDHFGGIPFFLLDAIFVRKRTRPLTIIGPQGCQSKVYTLAKALYPEILDKLSSFELFFKEYGMGHPLIIDDLIIEALPVVHSPESIPHGLRMSFGKKVIAYSGDTEWTENLLYLSQDTDIFLCECNFLHGAHRGHLSHETLLRRKSDFSANRILLTHMGEQVIEHSHLLEFEVSEQGKHYII